MAAAYLVSFDNIVLAIGIDFVPQLSVAVYSMHSCSFVNICTCTV